MGRLAHLQARAVVRSLGDDGGCHYRPAGVELYALGKILAPHGGRFLASPVDAGPF